MYALVVGVAELKNTLPRIAVIAFLREGFSVALNDCREVNAFMPVCVVIPVPACQPLSCPVPAMRVHKYQG